MKILSNTNTNKDITAKNQIISEAAKGTPPLVVSSDTLVSNLNADLLDGKDASAFATASHAHGNIASGGTIASAAITPANTDYILLSDASNSGKIEKGIAIGTGTTTYLRQDGTWVVPTVPQATETVLGGIKAKAKTTETAEVAIDTSTGKLYAPSVDPNEMSYFDYAGNIYGAKYSLLANAWQDMKDSETVLFDIPLALAAPNQEMGGWTIDLYVGTNGQLQALYDACVNETIRPPIDSKTYDVYYVNNVATYYMGDISGMVGFPIPLYSFGLFGVNDASFVIGDLTPLEMGLVLFWQRLSIFQFQTITLLFNKVLSLRTKAEL